MLDAVRIFHYNHILDITNEPVHEKTNNLGSEQVQHKLGGTTTDG